MHLKLTSRRQRCFLMDIVISGTYLVSSSIEMCVLSVSVLSALGGLARSHYPNIASPPPVRHANPYGNRKISLKHLGKVAYNSPPHTLPAQSWMNRVSHTQLSLPEWFNYWRMRVNGRGTLQMSAAVKRSGWLRLFSAESPSVTTHLHVVDFTSTLHFSLKGKLIFVGFTICDAFCNSGCVYVLYYY